MSGLAHLATRFLAGVYSFDTEYRAVPGAHQVVHCLVVRNLLTGEVWRYDRADLDRLTDCPLPTGSDALC